MSVRTLPLLLLSLSLAACAGGDDPSDTDAAMDPGTDDDGRDDEDDEDGEDSGSSDDDDTGSAGDTDDSDTGEDSPVTSDVHEEGWEGLPFVQSIFVGAPDGMTMVDSVGGEVGGINTRQQNPPYGPNSGDWCGYLQVRPQQGSSASVGLRTDAFWWTVQEAGEEHRALVKVSQSVANPPSSGMILEVRVGGTVVASQTFDNANLQGLGSWRNLSVTYTTVPDDVGETLDLTLRVTQGPGSGTYSLLVDDLDWTVTR